LTRVGYPERERAADALRRHYVAGRLSEEELEHRTELALAARDRRDLRAALVELPPPWMQVEETVVPSLQAAAERVRRAAVAVSAFVVWLMLSATLLVLLVAVAADHGSSLDLVGFPLAWLVVTAVLYRKATARRGSRRR
jgi:hypothetical protein